MFTKPTRTWFNETFPAPTEVQRRGWEAIAGGDHVLLVAPTGSGKTLAAFLAGIDALASREPGAPNGTRVLYVSPLKALVYDVERNLRAPLAGIQRTSERLGMAPPRITVAVRTGDTPQRERQRQVKEPGDILVTTPESLFLILGSQARATLRRVGTVIIDEVHAVAPSKRGTHLAVTLERLCAITERDPQRIGLSATVRPLDEIARYVGGTRPVEVVDASARPNLDLTVTVPVPDMTDVHPPDSGATAAKEKKRGGPILSELYDREIHTPVPERGIWAAVYPKLLDEIRDNTSTIIFTNSRGLCERLAQRLNDLAGEEIVRAHHGSVSHEQRSEIEEGLKSGEIRGIVATSSLELGIDMGAVDRVILVESPGSVARGLQRVGRAGHQVGEVSVGRIYPKYRGDLLEAAVIASEMREGRIEALKVPRNALDVLAQQVVAMCCDRDHTVDEIEALVQKSHPFRELTRGALEAVLDMLSGRYPSADFADLRPLLSWDRASNVLRARRGAVLISRMNPGTIPDRGTYSVHLGAGGPRIGELDEEMVFESRKGDNILLGATTWKVEEITRDRVVVTPAPGQPGRLPFWKGEGPGRPVEVGRAVGAFLREYGAVAREKAADWVVGRTPLDAYAAQNLVAYLNEQREHAGVLPSDRLICVERFRDELGDWRLCILSPFGARVHAPWAMAIQRGLSGRTGFEAQIMYSEDGIVLRFADGEELPDLESLLPEPEEAEDLVTEQLSDAAMFAGLFRENAVRSLLLPRRRPTSRNPLWAQRLKSQQLLASVRRYPSFPIVLETYRQALRDVFDLPGLQDVLRDIRMRRIRVHEVETRSASPFARSLVFAYVAAYMYEQDAPVAERRAQALTLDRNLLNELLGQAELRQLIDPQVLAEVEDEIQHTADDRKARDADELHDVLRRLGDLSPDEIRDRAAGDADVWLAGLERERRAARLQVAGEARWIAAEDAGLYRDALGCMPPPGLPSSFLEPADRPMQQIVTRFVRHRGPFVPRDAAHRYGLRTAQVELLIQELERDGSVVRGEIRPGGAEIEVCDAEILRRLKRRTLARLRDEVAPVDAQTLAVFLPQWQGIDSGQGGPDRLLEAVATLEGLALPWSELVDAILPRRVARFSVDQLDTLCASGDLVWVGRGPLGARDGRVALYLRDHAAERIESPDDEEPLAGVHDTILRTLRERGATFLDVIERAVRQAHPATSAGEFRAALWDLVWRGMITNDTFGPLQALRRRPRGPSRRGRRASSLPGGRWWCVDTLVTEVSETARAVARARQLLERYGVLSREAVQAENIPGGFAPVYKVLKAMEESGQIRRGHFVEGLTGAQFAHAGAVDRLRGVRSGREMEAPFEERDVLVLSAIDPANPYGALLPWPEPANPNAVRPRRVPGAAVFLVRGLPALYAARRGRQLVTFRHEGRPAREMLRAAVPSLRRMPRGTGKRRILIEEMDGRRIEDSEHLDLLRACGFEKSYRGLVDVKS